MRAAIAVAVAVVGLSGCGLLSFERRQSTEELVLKEQLRSYYAEVKTAFATGNGQRLAALFDPSITTPMTHGQIKNWADAFFAEHGRASFRVNKLDIEQLGFSEAVAVLHYTVSTPSGKGAFSGVERDYLLKRNGRWFITRWEKLQR